MTDHNRPAVEELTIDELADTVNALDLETLTEVVDMNVQNVGMMWQLMKRQDRQIFRLWMALTGCVAAGLALWVLG